MPLLGLFISIAIILFQYFSLSNDLKNREIKFAREMMTNIANALQGDLNTSLLDGDLVKVKQDIAKVNFLPSAKRVYLINEKNVIIASGDLGTVGKSTNAIERPVDAYIFNKIREQMRGKVFLSDEDLTLMAIYPIVLGRKKGEFRPSIIGAVLIEFDLKENLASLHASVIDATTKTATFVAGVLLLCWVAIHFIITNRVKGILNAAKVYAAGDRKVRVNLGGSDEFSLISRAFDNVADSVEEADLEIRKSQQSLNRAQRIAHLGNWQWDIRTGSLFWSDEIYRIFGYEPHAFASTYEAFLEAVHPEDRDIVVNAVGLALETKSEYKIVHRVLRPDGQIRVVLEVGELDLDEAGEAIIMNGTVLDITERHNAEQEVKQLNASLEQRVLDRTKELQDEVKERKNAEDKYRVSEERTAEIVNSAVDAIITIDSVGTVKTFNPAAEKTFGWKALDVVGKNINILMPDPDKENHDNYISNYLKTNVGNIIGVGRSTQGMRKDGEIFPIELSIGVSEIGDEKIFTGIIRDISERQALENELKVKDQIMRDCIEHIPGGMTFYDKDLKVLFANRKMAEWYCAPKEAFAYGEPIETFITFLAERGDLGEGPVEKLVQDRLKFHAKDLDQTYEFTSPEGRICEVRRATAKEGGLVTMMTDITARKKTEAELLQTQDQLVAAEKMASLGGLVAGVAHEINTPVGVSVTAASHLTRSTSQIFENYENQKMKKTDLEKYFEDASQSSKIILSNLERAANLISSFKKVAVDQSSEEVRTFGLSAYLDEVLLSLNPNLKKHQQEVSISCDPNISVTCDPGNISQIVTNLVMNSLVHGFDGEDKGEIRIDITQKDDEITLLHSDTGKGMNEETLSKVFEPFFTTKRGSGGSGLGMHIIFNLIVNNLKGSIDCKSKLGEGTQFIIKFPKGAST